MVRKSGRSEEKETWYGEKYTQHYDSEGKESGTSKKEKDWLGQEKIQHYDPEGKRSGHSKEERNWLGEKKIQHYGSTDKRSDVDVGGYDHGSGSHSGTECPPFLASTLAIIPVTVYVSGLIGLIGLPTGDDLRNAFEIVSHLELLLFLLVFIFLWSVPIFLIYKLVARSFVGILLVSLSAWGFITGFIPNTKRSDYKYCCLGDRPISLISLYPPLRVGINSGD